MGSSLLSAHVELSSDVPGLRNKPRADPLFYPVSYSEEGPFGETVEVVFSAASEDTRSIELHLRQPQQFLQAIGAT